MKDEFVSDSIGVFSNGQTVRAKVGYLHNTYVVIVVISLFVYFHYH